MKNDLIILIYFNRIREKIKEIGNTYALYDAYDDYILIPRISNFCREFFCKICT